MHNLKNINFNFNEFIIIKFFTVDNWEHHEEGCCWLWGYGNWHKTHKNEACGKKCFSCLTKIFSKLQNDLGRPGLIFLVSGFFRVLSFIYNFRNPALKIAFPLLSNCKSPRRFFISILSIFYFKIQNLNKNSRRNGERRQFYHKLSRFSRCSSCQTFQKSMKHKNIISSTSESTKKDYESKSRFFLPCAFSLLKHIILHTHWERGG